MIKREEVVEVGKFLKAHGLYGEVNAVLDSTIDPDSLECVVVEIEGIFVPFFITSWREKGSESCLLKLEGFEDSDSLQPILGKEIYALRRNLPELDNGSDGFYLSDLMGYTIVDDCGNEIAVIDDFDDSTQNILLLTRNSKGESLYIPFVEEFIKAIDVAAKKIEMDLPSGILTLN